MRRAVEVTTLLLVLVYGTYLLVGMLAHADHHWDFKTYHGAARTALMGLDPYSAADMRKGCEDYTRMPFVYTPVAFARDLAERGIHTPASGPVVVAVYGVVVAAVCAVSVWAASRIVKSADDASARRSMLVFLACLAYAIILPRFKNYSYVLLLLPVFATLMRASTTIKPQYLLLALPVLSTGANSWLPGVRAGYAFVRDYVALAVTFGAWALLVARAIAPYLRTDVSAAAPPA
jgi:hypothetical protein